MQIGILQPVGGRVPEAHAAGGGDIVIDGRQVHAVSVGMGEADDIAGDVRRTRARRVSRKRASGDRAGPARRVAGLGIIGIGNRADGALVGGDSTQLFLRNP